MTDDRINTLEQAVNGLTKQLRNRTECEKNQVWLIRGIWALFLSLVGLIFTSVFFLGGLNTTVERLEENEIDKEVFNTYKKRTDDTYNMTFFKKDTRFTLRGNTKEI